MQNIVALELSPQYRHEYYESELFKAVIPHKKTEAPKKNAQIASIPDILSFYMYILFLCALELYKDGYSIQFNIFRLVL